MWSYCWISSLSVSTGYQSAFYYLTVHQCICITLESLKTIKGHYLSETCFIKIICRNNTSKDSASETSQIVDPKIYRLGIRSWLLGSVSDTPRWLIPITLRCLHFSFNFLQPVKSTSSFCFSTKRCFIDDKMAVNVSMYHHSLFI